MTRKRLEARLSNSDYKGEPLGLRLYKVATKRRLVGLILDHVTEVTHEFIYSYTLNMLCRQHNLSKQYITGKLLAPSAYQHRFVSLRVKLYLL